MKKKICIECDKEFIPTGRFHLRHKECAGIAQKRRGAEYRDRQKRRKLCIECKKAFQPNHANEKLCRPCAKLRQSMSLRMWAVRRKSYRPDIEDNKVCICYCGKRFIPKDLNQSYCTKECGKKIEAQKTQMKNARVMRKQGVLI